MSEIIKLEMAGTPLMVFDDFKTFRSQIDEHEALVFASINVDEIAASGKVHEDIAEELFIGKADFNLYDGTNEKGEAIIQNGYDTPVPKARRAIRRWYHVCTGLVSQTWSNIYFKLELYRFRYTVIKVHYLTRYFQRNEISGARIKKVGRK